MRNLKSVEALKKFRLLNRKFYEIGTKALLDDERDCRHLRGVLQFNESPNEEQLEHLLFHGSTARRVSIDLGILAKRSVEDTRKIRKIICSCLKDMEVVVVRCMAWKSLEELGYNPAPIFQKTDSLPNLRSIHLHWECHLGDSTLWTRAFVEELLSVAVNLIDPQCTRIFTS